MNAVRVSPLMASVLYLLGLCLVFVGERIVQASSLSFNILRAVLSVGGLVLIIGATVFRWWRLRASTADAKFIERVIALFCSVGLVAILIYFATVAPGADWIGISSLSSSSRDRIVTVATVAWIILLLLSIVPLLFTEIALLPMRYAQHVEWRRARDAMLAGLTIALAASYGSFFVYIAGQLNIRADYSYFKTSSPSESTIAMTANLTDKVQIITFFPPVNDVHEEVMNYLDALQNKARGIEVQVQDRLVSPALAQQMHVAEDGVIVVVREKQSELIVVGTQMNRARATLKNLDQEVQKALGKVLRNQRIAYLTVGHGELNDSQRDGKVTGRSVQALRELLQFQNYEVRDLGLVQGLGRDVPGDATMLLILGPMESFAGEELKAIKRYIMGGGRVLMALEAQGKSNSKLLASMVGLTFDSALVCHSEHHGVRRRNESDQSIIFSNRYASHPAVATLARLQSRAVFFIGAGALEKAPKADSMLDVSFVLNSLPGSWMDANGDFVYDPPGEKIGLFKLVGAVTKTIVIGPEGSDPAVSDKHQPKQMRALVVADSDVLSDATLMNPSNFNGNPQFFVDAVRWLAGDEPGHGQLEVHDDVRIEHTKQQDKAYFYMTILVIPALVLSLGWWVSRKNRLRPQGLNHVQRADQRSQA